MQDRIFEHQSFPQPFDLLRFRKPLVLAPHPDDEIFGCAGLMLMWLRSGIRARAVVLTDGLAQHDGDAELGAPSRIAESEAAAALLGHELTTWKLQDRELRCDESLIERMVEAIVEHAPDVVLVPALTEPHPDHQATTLAVACALARLQPQGLRPDLLLYESGGALTHPNLLIDISEVVDTKTQAMACFRSQEGFQPYASRIRARDHFRAMPLGPSAQAAEGFQLLPVREKGWPAVLPALEPLYLHGRGQAASELDLPLVSVLIRTTGDAHLEKTLASVCAQTYPRLEVVLVDAANQKVEPAGLPARQDIKRIWVGAGKTQSRPEAANAALDAARGEWLIFLDDDDLWTPEHVAKLVGAQRASGQVRAVHTDVQVIDEQGRELTRYDQAFQAERMAFTNVLPIHSVLFDARLVRERGCRFDEQLPVLEDWDFWLQVGEIADIAHVPGVSAFYRYRDRSGLESPDHAHHQRQWRDKVLARWMQRRGAEATLSAIRWYVKSLDERQQQLEAAQRQGSAVEHERQAWALERHTWTTERLQLEAARTQALEQLGATVHDVHRAYAAWEEDRGRWEQERQALEAARTQALEQLEAAVQDVHRAYAAWEEDRGRWEQERQAWEMQRGRWEEERAQWNAERGHLQQLNGQMSADLVEQHRLVDALRATRSWRWTRPLRWLASRWQRATHLD
jgi:LmbE family N-acetylglucosaminyl deacetylase